jgi:hypothetical protein
MSLSHHLKDLLDLEFLGRAVLLLPDLTSHEVLENESASRDSRGDR